MEAQIQREHKAWGDSVNQRCVIESGNVLDENKMLQMWQESSDGL